MNSVIILACAVAAISCHSVPSRSSYVRSPTFDLEKGLRTQLIIQRGRNNNRVPNCPSHCTCSGCHLDCSTSCRPSCCKPVPQYITPSQSYVLAPSTAQPCCPPNVPSTYTTNGYAVAPTCVPCTTSTTTTTTTTTTKAPCTVPTEAPTTTEKPPCYVPPKTTQSTTVTTEATTVPSTTVTTEKPATTTTATTTTTTPPTCSCNITVPATTTTTLAPTTTPSTTTTVRPCPCQPEKPKCECNCNSCKQDCAPKQNCNCKTCTIYYPTVIVANPETTCFVNIQEVRTTISVYCGCTSQQGANVTEVITRCSAVDISVADYRQISLFANGVYPCNKLFTTISRIEQYIVQQCEIVAPKPQPTNPVVIPGYPVVPVVPEQYPTEAVATFKPVVDTYEVHSHVESTTSSSSTSVVSWVAVSASMFALVVAFITVA